METFNITIEELLSQEFTIEAGTREQAVEKAIKVYKQGKLVLEPGNLEMRRIALSDNLEDWVEF